MLWLLGILGTVGAAVGGVALLGGGPAMLGAGVKLLGFARRIPPKTWLYIAVAVAVVAGVVWHQHRAHAAIAAAEARGVDRANAIWSAKVAKVAAEAAAVRRSAERVGAAISKEERTKDDEARIRNATTSDALRLRGAGAAASHCRPLDHPGLAAAAGGHEPGAAGPDAAGPPVPAGDWALVPWGWLVERAREHDDGLAEIIAWRSSDQRQREAWEKMRAAPK
jgi:hypothetical protein